MPRPARGRKKDHKKRKGHKMHHLNRAAREARRRNAPTPAIDRTHWPVDDWRQVPPLTENPA